MPKSTAVHTIDEATTADSRKRAATIGMATRISAAAIANAPRIVPITDAEMPRSWPSTGNTNVCTSQQDEMNQLTSSKRRNRGSCSISQARALSWPCGRITGGNSFTAQTQNQDAAGSTAINRYDQRKPAWA